jgi:hypothetical protein
MRAKAITDQDSRSMMRPGSCLRVKYALNPVQADGGVGISSSGAGEIQKPQEGIFSPRTGTIPESNPLCDETLQTPTTSNNLSLLRSKIEQDIDGLDDLSRFRLQKLSNAAEKAFAERSLLLDDNRLLFAQNNEKVSRKSARSTVVGTAKVMSYEDIVEAQTNRDAKAAGRIPKRKSALTAGQERGSRSQEVEKAEEEIRTLGLANYCSVLHFD